jgi:Type I restriction modification DNA specificity domain
LNARFVARFLNSEFGKEIRELTKSGTVIPKLNKQTLKDISIFVPDLQTQKMMLETEARIAAEQNTLLGLQNELGAFHRELWTNPRSVSIVRR